MSYIFDKWHLRYECNAIIYHEIYDKYGLSPVKAPGSSEEKVFNICLKGKKR